MITIVNKGGVWALEAPRGIMVDVPFINRTQPDRVFTVNCDTSGIPVTPDTGEVETGSTISYEVRPGEARTLHLNPWTHSSVQGEVVRYPKLKGFEFLPADGKVHRLFSQDSGDYQYYLACLSHCSDGQPVVQWGRLQNSSYYGQSHWTWYAHKTFLIIKDGITYVANPDFRRSYVIDGEKAQSLDEAQAFFANMCDTWFPQHSTTEQYDSYYFAGLSPISEMTKDKPNYGPWSHFTNDTPSTLELSDIRRILHPYIPKSQLDPTSRTDWYDLSAKAVSNINMLEFNGISFLKDTLSIGSTLKDFIKGLRSIGKKKAKALAGAYLTEHYGIRLQIRDTFDLLYAMQDLKHREPYLVSYGTNQWATQNGVSQRETYGIYYDRWSNFDSKIKDYIQYLDLDLDANSSWDMVPFSFVVDWFLHIGDLLDVVSQWENLQTLKVYCTSQSILQSRNISDVELPDGYVVNNLQQAYYIRVYRKNLIPPLPQPSTPTPPGVKHFWEAAALTLQRMK